MRCVYVLLPDPRGGFPGVRRDDKGEEFRFQPTYLFPLFPFSPGKKLAGIIGKLDDLFRERAFENGGSGGRHRIVKMKLIPSLSFSFSYVARTQHRTRIEYR